MGSLIRDTFRAMIGGVGYLFDDTDLVLSQWLALKLMSGGAIACVGDVSRELGIDTGASTRLVDQLAERGMLIRCRSKTDRRVVGIFLTSTGADFIAQMQPRLTSFWRERLGIFSSDEQALLFRMLIRLRDKLSEEGLCHSA